MSYAIFLVTTRQVTVECNLEAFPSNLTFHWRFNNSGEIVPISPGHLKTKGLSSTLSYVARTDLDYGTLLCWGENVLGEQFDPCRFSVVASETPQQLKNCNILNAQKMNYSYDRDGNDFNMTKKDNTSDAKHHRYTIEFDEYHHYNDTMNQILFVKCDHQENSRVRYSGILYEGNSNIIYEEILNSTVPEFEFKFGAEVRALSFANIVVYSVNSRGNSKKVILRLHNGKSFGDEIMAGVRHNPSEHSTKENIVKELASEDGRKKPTNNTAGFWQDGHLLAVFLAFFGCLILILLAAFSIVILKKRAKRHPQMRKNSVSSVDVTVPRSPDSTSPDVHSETG